VSNYNKVVLLGNLTRDPELSSTKGGTPVCNFTIAHNRRFRQGEEFVSEATFVDISIFGPQAETFVNRHHKGSPCFIEGQLRQDRWEDQDGNNRTKLYVVADTWVRLPSREPATVEVAADEY
jgi:single-strand DNA-binding protein